MHNIILYVIIFLFGSVIGSFLNVCIYRIPRNLSIITPSSRCPSCNIPIKPLDNIPILSYIFLGGRCRACKAKISFRYPLVELLNAALYILVLWRFGLDWHTLVYFIFCSALVAITFIDLDFQIIPDRITLSGIPIGLVAGSFLLPDPFMRYSLLGYKASIRLFNRWRAFLCCGCSKPRWDGRWRHKADGNGWFLDGLEGGTSYHISWQPDRSFLWNISNAF